MADARDTMLGQLAVKKGLITGSQLADVLKAQEDIRAATGRTMQLGEVLLERGLVDRDALRDLLKLQASRATRELGGFELISRLGAGGMGAVYKARQKSMDRVVALKVLPPKLAQDETFIQRFYREARAVAKLNHPNIVQGIDVGQSSGYFYFAMELVEGSSLRDLIEERGELPEKEALGIIEGVVKGLGHAHKHGLIHRDIKPDNVLIDKSGVAKVCDLGLARLTHEDSSLTQTGMALGTPHYISPEQARGESDLDARADLYSLGATWFHVLAGRPPYMADNALAVVTKHLTDPVPRLSAAKSGVSAGVEAVIAKLMAKDRADRYSSADELLKDIADMTAGRLPAIAVSAGAGHITAKTAPVRARDTRLHAPVGRRAAMPDLPDGVDLGPEPVPAPTGALSRRPVQYALAAGVLLAAALGTWGIRRAMSGPEPVQPPPGVAPGPGSKPEPEPIPGPENPEARLARLKEMYDHIRKTAEEEPDKLDLLEKRWGMLRDAGKGTKYALLAMDEIGKVVDRRREAGRNRLREALKAVAGLEKNVGELISRKEFGPAMENIKTFPRELGESPEAKRRLGLLDKSIRGAAQKAVAAAINRSDQLTRAGKFEEARQALGELGTYGLPKVLPIREKYLAKVNGAEAKSRRREEREALERCRQTIAKLKGTIQKREFAKALGELETAAKGLPPGSEAIVDPERQLLAAAAEFMKHCRRRAKSPPPGLRLTVQNIKGKITSYDPKTDELVVTRKLRSVRGSLEGKGRLRALPVDELLKLAGWENPKTIAAGEALAAGCFVVSASTFERAKPYFDKARAGKEVSADLERALAVRQRGEVEVLAEEKFGRLEKSLADKRWKDGVALARELLDEYAATAFLKPRVAKVKEMLEKAEDAINPLVRYTVVLQDGKDVPVLGLGSYRGMADTFLGAERDGAEINGRSPTLKAFNRGAQAALMRFDLAGIPRGARIEKAKLEIHCESLEYGFKPNVSKVHVYAMKASWDERSATYNHRFRAPGQELAWTEKGGRKERDTTTNWGHGRNGKAAEFTCAPGRWSECDITRLVAAWVSGAKQNHGFYLYADAAGLASLRSRESDAALRPRLTITFRSPRLKKVAGVAFLPRNAKVYAFDSKASVKQFVGDFDLSKLTRNPDSRKSAVALGRGQLSAKVISGEAMVITSKRLRYGRERSVSFQVDIGEKALKDRGYVAFGFPVSRKPDMRKRLAVIFGAVPRLRGLTNAFHHDDGQELRSKRLIPGGTVPVGGSVFGSYHVRISWRSPNLAWFVNGKRTGAGHVSGDDARKVSEAPVALYCGMFLSPAKGDKLTIKISKIAVGLPHTKDFDGAARLPEPPGPGPSPRPRPRHWRPRDGGRRPRGGGGNRPPPPDMK